MRAAARGGGRRRRGVEASNSKRRRPDGCMRTRPSSSASIRDAAGAELGPEQRLLREELQQELAMDGSCVQNLAAVVEGGVGVSGSRAMSHRSSSWLGVCVLHGQVLRPPCCSSRPMALDLYSKQAKSSGLQADGQVNFKQAARLLALNSKLGEELVDPIFSGSSR